MAGKMVPFTLAWDDDLPLDISFIFEEEKPAGKHGFLTAQGERFVFADGVAARFWGTNFNSGANFPPHETAEMVARRLAKLGVNIVRTHQMDAEWSTPNIFTFNRARPKDNTRTLDPQSLDRLDYLVHCLKEQGIYLYLDMLTYRQFLPVDAVDAWESLPQAAKPYLYFDRCLIELQKEYNEALWGHLNPYTGVSYADEPAIALTELVNEADPFTHRITLEPYRTRLELLYRAWLEERSLDQPVGTVDFTRPDAKMGRFYVEMMRAYNREMKEHLRKIGVKIPITGTNWTTRLGVTAAQSEMDFNDSHVYWNYPWTGPVGTVTRQAMVASAVNDFATLTAMRAVERPFFVSEWDHAYPAEYRAESSLALAGAAAFQGWGGCAIHTYRYGTWTPENRIAGGASTINGVVYRNFFDAFNDPAKFGLFYQAALLLRRGDVTPGKGMAALRVKDEPGWEMQEASDLPGLAIISEQRRVGILLPGETARAEAEQPAGDPSVDPGLGEVVSDTGELWRSWNKRFGWIDTPRSKVAYGFLGEAGKIALKSLELEVKTDYAVIAMGSLTDDPLEESPSILLTAVGRCENSAAQYTPDGSRLVSAGKPPVLIEAIQADVRLYSKLPNLKVLVISEHGELVKKLPTKYDGGVLSFSIGPQADYDPSTIYYLIRR